MTGKGKGREGTQCRAEKDAYERLGIGKFQEGLITAWIEHNFPGSLENAVFLTSEGKRSLRDFAHRVNDHFQDRLTVQNQGEAIEAIVFLILRKKKLLITATEDRLRIQRPHQTSSQSLPTSLPQHTQTVVAHALGIPDRPSALEDAEFASDALISTSRRTVTFPDTYSRPSALADEERERASVPRLTVTAPETYSRPSALADEERERASVPRLTATAPETSSRQSYLTTDTGIAPTNSGITPTMALSSYLAAHVPEMSSRQTVATDAETTIRPLTLSPLSSVVPEGTSTTAPLQIPALAICVENSTKTARVDLTLKTILGTDRNGFDILNDDLGEAEWKRFLDLLHEEDSRLNFTPGKSEFALNVKAHRIDTRDDPEHCMNLNARSYATFTPLWRVTALWPKIYVVLRPRDITSLSKPSRHQAPDLTPERRSRSPQRSNNASRSDTAYPSRKQTPTTSQHRKRLQRRKKMIISDEDDDDEDDGDDDYNGDGEYISHQDLAATPTPFKETRATFKSYLAEQEAQTVQK